MKKKLPLQIIPLGGLGEIGMNLTLYGVGDDWIAIDAGTQFCDPSYVGIEQMLPDLDLLSEYRGRIHAILITHGHEDHIGSAAHVAATLNAPVYATAFVVELIRLKESEYGTVERPTLNVVAPGDELSFGPMKVRYLPVTHSIPDACAIAIDTPSGTIVHTGDFKMDATPVAGPAFDPAPFRDLGKRGVRMLLSDSTNAQVPGHTRSEKDVVTDLADLMDDAPGRVIISMFASNVNRVRGLAEAAQRSGRRVAMVGRSLSLYLEASVRAGLGPTITKMVDPQRLDLVDDDRILILCTGSQAEPRSALFRASNQDHQSLRIKPGDTIVLSSRIIPGNERSIHRMVGNLTRLGARVLHAGIASVHGSGHAQQDELKEMIALTQPRTFVPIHGEHHYLKSHAELATAMGIEEVLTLENGHVLEVTPDDACVVDHLSLATHYVDGPIVGDAEELHLTERRRLSYNGAIAANLVARQVRKRWKVDVDLQSVGCAVNGGMLLDEAADYAVSQLTALPAGATRRQFEETLSGSLRAFFRRSLDKRPVILSFIEVSEK